MGSTGKVAVAGMAAAVYYVSAPVPLHPMVVFLSGTFHCRGPFAWRDFFRMS